MGFSDLLKDLDPKYASALSEITDHLRQEFDEKLSATRAALGLEAATDETEETAEEAPAAAVDVVDLPDPIEELKQAVVAVDAAGSQGEILDSLVAGCARFASRCAIFLVREGQATGWTSHGFSLSDDDMKAVSFPIEPGSPWDSLSAGDGTVALDAAGCGPLCDRFGGEAAEMGLLVPFVLNNQTAAGVYCDRLEGDEGPNVAALQLLTFIASQVLENLPVRDRASTSTLSLAAGGEAAVAEPPAEAEPEPAIEEEPEPVIEEDAEPEAAEEEAEEEAGEEPVAEMEEYDAEPSPEALFEAEAEPEPEPPAPMEVPEVAEDYGMPAIDTAPEPEPPLASDSGAELGAAVAEEPEPPAAEPSMPMDEEPPAPTLLSDATTQVAPPTDLEGPGWAFSGAGAAAPDTGDESQHEEARRLARLLVTEVKLYNEELVEQGRKNGNVYSVLKDDIERSRQIFEDRIAEDVRSHSDYFHEALVRILAGGDPSVLGA